MRIDKLEIKNFKKFAEQTIELHPQFNLLVGDNGSGKTTILDALAVALSIWLENAPDPRVQKGVRAIQESDIRLLSEKRGDRVQFRPCLPVSIKATGLIGDQDIVDWIRTSPAVQGEGNVHLVWHAANAVKAQYSRAQIEPDHLLPVLASYGAGRRWLPSRVAMPTPSDDHLKVGAEPSLQMLVGIGLAAYTISAESQGFLQPYYSGPARRWAAFFECLHGRINFQALQQWFLLESIEAINRRGRIRPGFEVVRRAILRCVPGGDEVYYSADLNQIVLSIHGQHQPFGNLSDGQQMVLALVADLAIKAVTQNAHLLPPDQLGLEDEPLPRVLRDTPGVVLIDELDVHLHPNWQRMVAADLKATFPSIQFVCTSHSAQVIGELSREEILLLREQEISHPQVARGADSNWILDHVLDGAASENAEARALREQVEEALDEGDLPRAQGALAALRAYMKNGVTSTVVGLQTRLATYEALAEDSEESDGGGTP